LIQFGGTLPQFSLAGKGSVAIVRTLSAPPTQHIAIDPEVTCHLADCFAALVAHFHGIVLELFISDNLLRFYFYQSPNKPLSEA
jgi:hypothetical protein